MPSNTLPDFENLSTVIRELSKRYSDTTIRKECQDWFYTTYYLKKGYFKEKNDNQEFEVGKIYAGFHYPNPKYKDKLDFYNTFPTALCIGYHLKSNGKRNPIVLNLNYIPPKIRLAILDKIVNTYNTQYINPNYQKVARGKKTIKVVPTWYKILKQLLKRSGFEFAIRSYIPSRIKGKPQIVTYSDWYKLMFITNKYIVKLSQRQIYIMYKKNLDEGFKVGTKEKKLDLRNSRVKDLKKLVRQENKKLPAKA